MDLVKIKKLREETSFGMLEVKNALHEANDDLDLAREILSKLNKDVQTNTRVASKGLTKTYIEGNDAILFEINAETDFVSKHPVFIKLIEDLAPVLMKSKAVSVSEALKVKINDQTVKDYINQVGNIIKENTFLRRFHRIRKTDEQHYASYTHQGGKISVLVIMNEKDDILGKDIAMQIASGEPKYLSVDKIDEQTILYEKMMMEKEGKSVTSKDIHAYLESSSLYDQPFIKNPNLKVKEILGNRRVIDFYRFELGQGIENKLNCRLDVPCDGSTITFAPQY